jgi:hypothetical protein
MLCFQDSAISQKIARQSTELGYCERCTTQRAILVECSELSSDFSILLSLYQESADGEHLLELLERDWDIFSSKVSDKRSLLDALLPETVGTRYIAIQSVADTAQNRWIALKDELKYKNRFFPESAPNQKELAELLGLLVISQNDLPRNFFRARVQRGEEAFSLIDLMAPPVGVAQAGRANPPGLSYLYVASDRDTALAEVRPTVADVVSVAQFEATRNFKLVDLSDPRSQISPFRLGIETLSNVRAEMAFLSMLSEDLTRPTPVHKAPFDYLATQYLCELIKRIGYDGVRYRSSLKSGGYNFAFFDVEALRPVTLHDPLVVAGVTLNTIAFCNS